METNPRIRNCSSCRRDVLGYNIPPRGTREREMERDKKELEGVKGGMEGATNLPIYYEEGGEEEEEEEEVTPLAFFSYNLPSI